MVCQRLQVPSQQRKRGRDEDRDMQGLGGEEQKEEAAACKWRHVSGETMPVLLGSEWISAGTTEKMHGPF